MRPARHAGRDQRGWVTLWVLGLSVAVLLLGGLGLDFWRALAVRRDLAATADAAAAAGATALDPAALRGGTLVLDPAEARARAVEHLPATAARATVDVTGTRVTVALEARVPFTLLQLFLGGDAFTVRARATAEPRRFP